MQEFQIRLRSVRDVQDVVAIATARPFAVTLRDARNKVNGKSFMDMFCLDFSRPLRVVADCTEQEAQALRLDADRFLVK